MAFRSLDNRYNTTTLQPHYYISSFCYHLLHQDIEKGDKQLDAAALCKRLHQNKNVHQGEILQQQLSQKYNQQKKKLGLEATAASLKRAKTSTMAPGLRPDVPEDMLLVNKKQYNDLKKELDKQKTESKTWNEKYKKATKKRDEALAAKKKSEGEYDDLLADHEELKGKVEDIVAKSKGKSNNIQAKILQSSDVCEKMKVYVREYVGRTIKFILDDGTLKLAIDMTWEGMRVALKLERRPKNLTREKFGEIFANLF